MNWDQSMNPPGMTSPFYLNLSEGGPQHSILFNDLGLTTDP